MNQRTSAKSTICEFAHRLVLRSRRTAGSTGRTAAWSRAGQCLLWAEIT